MSLYFWIWLIWNYLYHFLELVPSSSYFHFHMQIMKKYWTFFANIFHLTNIALDEPTDKIDCKDGRYIFITLLGIYARISMHGLKKRNSKIFFQFPKSLLYIFEGKKLKYLLAICLHNPTGSVSSRYWRCRSGTGCRPWVSSPELWRNSHKRYLQREEYLLITKLVIF